MHIHESGVSRMPVSPNLVEQHLAREDLPWTACEAGEQIEFERRERDDLVSATDHVAGDVDFQITDREVLDERLRCRTQTCAESGNEFLRLERLVDVVVGTVLKSGHNVERVRACGQHHDRHPGLGANAPAYLDAIFAREHDIKQDDVRLAIPEDCKCLVAIGAKNRFESFSTQHDAEHLGERCVIIDYKNPVGHGHILSPRPNRRHVGGQMPVPNQPMRLGEMLVLTFRFMRAHAGATLGIGALLATVSATVSGVVTQGVVMQIDGIRLWNDTAGEAVTAGMLDELSVALREALPWFLAVLAVSFVVQLAATGVMTLAVIRDDRDQSVQPGELWRDVPWQRLIGINLLIVALILLAAVGPIALLLISDTFAIPALLVMFASAVAIALGTSLAVPAAMREDLGARAALSRSFALIKRSWMRTAGLLVAANLIWSSVGSLIAAPVGAIAGSLAGGSRSTVGQTLQTLLTDIASGAVALPGIAIMTTLIYFDRVQRTSTDQ